MNFLTENNLDFPPVESSPGDFPLAIGGDLSIERLLLAYKSGIFPWYSGGQPILWWSPDPRFILYPDKARISKSMKKYFSKGMFKITLDQDFPAVIKNCRLAKRNVSGTWILPEMQRAYTALHKEGYAHSVEVWHEKELVGGLYGVSLGRCFFGESMFTKESNASKFALLSLARLLREKEFNLIDCQVYTKHLASLGAQMLSRKVFLKILRKSLEKQTIRGNWQEVLLPGGTL